MRKRRRVQNHLGTVHAIAMANLCELAAGLATEVTLPTGLRWIPKSMTIEYLKRAATDLRAVCQLGADPAWRDGLELVMPVFVLDDSDTPVVQARITMWITARKAA